MAATYPETVVLSMTSPESALATLHYVYPIVVFAYFAIASVSVVFTLQGQAASKKTEPDPKRHAALGVLGILVSAHVAQLVIILVHSASLGSLPSDDNLVVGHLACILVFALQIARLFEVSRPVWYPFCGSWALALPFEAVVTASPFIGVSDPPNATQDFVDLGLGILRCVLITLLLVFYVRCRLASASLQQDEERQPLINKTNGSASDGTSSAQATDATATATNQEPSYGATKTSKKPQDGTANVAETPWQRRRRQHQDLMEKRLEASGNWLNYVKDFKVRSPPKRTIFPLLSPCLASTPAPCQGPMLRGQGERAGSANNPTGSKFFRISSFG